MPNDPAEAAPPTRPLRVLVATPLGEGGRGGIDRIMDEVRHELAAAPARGLKVRFTATRGQGHIALSVLHLGASLVRLAAGRLGGATDVMHVNLSADGSTRRKVILCRVARLLGVPYVIHLHGSRYRQFIDEVSPRYFAQIAAMFEGAARVVVLGKVWERVVTGKFPGTAGRIDILPNASRAPARLPARTADPATVLFLGEVGPRKGVPQLLEALDRMKAIPGWKAVIAGNGAVEATGAEIARRGLAGRVSLTGWVGPEAVRNLLNDAEILVLPSFDENLPMSVIEGMGYGLAVVATPVGAVEDIIEDGVTGLLVAVGDADGLSAQMKRLVENPDLRRSLGDRAARFHRDHLAIDAYVSRLAAIWRSAAA